MPTAEMTLPPHGVVRRIYGNLGLLLSGKAVAGLLSLAYMVISAHALGPTDYGVLILVHGFAMTVGGIVEFPGWHAIVRYGAHALDGGNTGRLVRLLRFATIVEGIGGALAVLTAAVLAPILGPHLGWSAEAQAFALPYSFAVLASIRATPAGYLQLMRRFDLLAAHNMIAPATRLLGAGIAWFAGAGLTGFLIAWLFAALVEWISLWIIGIVVARREVKAHRLVGSPRGAISENEGIWRFMVAANADVTFGDLAGRIAPLAVGWVLGPAAAGLYAVAQRATVIIQQPAQILGQAAYAELARAVAAGNRGAPLRHALLSCIGIALATALPVLIALALFAPQIVMLLAGPGFGAAATVLLWLAAARIILLIAPPASAALMALGRPIYSVSSNFAISLGMLPLLPLLMLHLGLVGAGLHALIQALLTSALLAGFVWRESGR